MNNLRSKLIRLAYRKPELRKDLLPLLKTAAKWENDLMVHADTHLGELVELTGGREVIKAITKVMVEYVAAKDAFYDFADKELVKAEKEFGEHSPEFDEKLEEAQQLEIDQKEAFGEVLKVLQKFLKDSTSKRAQEIIARAQKFYSTKLFMDRYYDL